MSKLVLKKSGLGTPAVFFTAISTILGAIMFLRFGWAVGQIGFAGVLSVIIIGHIITIATAMAIAEIATNQKVEGGGEYYIISRSFGLNIGGTIGIALYLSQAVSAAFYIIAFAKAFAPLFEFALAKYGWFFIFGDRTVTIPAILFLVFIILKQGAGIGLKMLYFVVAILFVALLLFFLGSTEYSQSLVEFPFKNGLEEVDFFKVFAICFPGFTGMTAGVGLSGDLKNPSKSIPVGTMAATVVGMLIYIGIIYKLAISASPEALSSNELIMSNIAIWGWVIIPFGLAAATFSSAIGSIIVAPRTLQALGGDKIFPAGVFNSFVNKNQKGTKEPINATIVTSIIAVCFVLINDVDAVAEVISIFFMITYGALCTISFFEHFAADPSYRPSFKSRWYLSLLGALGCFILMFQMNFQYALIGLICLVLIFFMVSASNKDQKGMTQIFQGVISQLSRRLQVFLQKVEKDQTNENWRPSVICISSDSFSRFAAFDLLRWISHKYGFGTYIHKIEGYVSKETKVKADESLSRLIKMADAAKSNVYLDTLISPSFTSAIAQVIQLPGISGKENNMILFEYDKQNPERLDDIIDNFPLIKSTDFDVALLASSVRSFGYKRDIHIWITSNDFENANLMILMGYIILGHREWRNGRIKIFTIQAKSELDKQAEKLKGLIDSGRLPISANNIELIPKSIDQEDKGIINNLSKDADLTIIGYRNELVKHNHSQVFSGFDNLGDILFINSSSQKEIK